MDLISLIVPIFKVEKYLDRCIESIVNQTYKNLEIILIDDGSPDKCGDICDEWAQKDTRIKVIHKVNGGVSSARNAGLDIATGEYVAFIDPDDYVSLDMFEYIINEIDDPQIDIIEYNFCNVIGDDFVENISASKIYESFDDILLDMFSLYISMGINKMYRRSVIGDIRFNCEYMVAEDTLFFVECCKNARKLKSVEKPVYYYVHHDSSMTHKAFHDRMFDIFDVLDYIAPYCSDGRVIAAYNYHYIYLCFGFLSIVLLQKVCLNRLSVLRANILRRKKHILFERPINTRNGVRKYGIKQKIFMLLLWGCPNFFYSLYSLYHKLKNRRKNEHS